MEVAEVARRIGSTRAALVRWEAGTDTPGLWHFRTLLGVYGVHSHQMLFGEAMYQLSPGEAQELRDAAWRLSPSLQAKALLVLAGGVVCIGA